MALVIETRTLRGPPAAGIAGASLGILVKKGERVEVLGAAPPSFVHIRALDLPGQPEGWVTESAIDRNATTIPPLAGPLIAPVVAMHAEAFGVNAHFLLAYAHMRSGFQTGKLPNGLEWGPFGFTPAEWAFFETRSDLGIELPAAAIDEWRTQSVAAAARVMLTHNLLIEALKRAPSWAELTLALIAGPRAVASAAAQPGAPLKTLIVADPQAPTIDIANLDARFGAIIGNATGATALANVSPLLQQSADATRALIEALIPDDGSGASVVVTPGEDTKPSVTLGDGVLIDISDVDLDALARVAASEVGHFGKHGQDQLVGGLGAVVDTIINRVAHVRFPNSIQAVIDEKKQFSAINTLGSWTKLPLASPGIAEIVRSHVLGRARGMPSGIGPSTHFLNPHFSSASALASWGNHVVTHAVAHFGSEAKKDVHYHGTAPGTGKPRAYIVQRGASAAQFTPEGELVTPVAPPPVAAPAIITTGGSAAPEIARRIVENARAELSFFENGQRNEEEDPYYLRVGTYWQAVNQPFDGRSRIPGEKPGTLIKPPWSSAFISYIVKRSGGGDRFLYAQAHAHYVQDFVGGRVNGLYRAHRPEVYAPKPGDIIHAGREGAKRFDFDAARQAYMADKRYASHSDFVVETRPDKGFLIAIGGNVSDSVSTTRVRINPNGTLIARSDSLGPLPWIAVLECLD